MRKYIYFYLVILILVSLSNAQIGIGVAGGWQYPGFSSSKIYNDQFEGGYGFGFLIGHDLYNFGNHISMNARYMVKIFYNTIKLHDLGKTEYKFNSFSADILFYYKDCNPFRFYSGLGLNLLTAQANTKYTKYRDELIIPILIIGLDYTLAEYYNIFTEFFLQYGYLEVYPENLPINGIGILIGINIFISN